MSTEQPKPKLVGAIIKQVAGENRTYLLTHQPDAICELCGKKDELRPYGPNGENICFDCKDKDPEAARKQFLKQAFGIEAGIVES